MAATDFVRDAPYQRFTAPFYRIGVALIIVSVALRLLWYHVATTDYVYFVRVWFEQLAQHGFSAFQQPFADYAPLYLYLIKLLTFIPVSSLYSAKTLSLLFDVLIAYFGYRVVQRAPRWAARPDAWFLAAAVLFSLPTIMLNSSLWGQSDSVYAAGIAASLYFMIVDAPLYAALAFGFAASIKVQAIFFAPIFIGYVLRRKETRAYFWIPPIFFVLSVLPAWFAGGSLGYWLFIYAKQAGEYPYLSVSGQSIFAFVQPYGLSAGMASFLFWLGIFAAAAIGLRLLIYVKRVPELTARTLVLVSFASALALPYFLPRMHERYFYLADVFSVLYAFYEPRRYLVPVLVVFASLVSYMPFLSSQVGFLASFHEDLRVPAFLLLIPLGYVAVDLWRTRRA